MSCGCNAKDQLALTRAGVCVLCVGAEARDCPATGKPITLQVSAARCPRGKFPGKDGIVRMLGMRWYGLPLPARWWLWVRWFNEMDRDEFIKSFSGCGCIRVLKDLWLRWHGRMMGKGAGNAYGHAVRSDGRIPQPQKEARAVAG